MKRQNLISAHLIQFCRFLRRQKFNLGPQEEVVALEALSVISFEKAENFKEALRSTLVKNKHQLERFDDLYLQYWSQVSKAEDSKEKDLLESKDQESKKRAPSLHVIKKWLHGNHNTDEAKIASFDTSEVYTDHDFSSFAKDDLSKAIKYTDLLAKKLSNKRSRRYVSANRSEILDLRRIMRKNFSKSDEIIFLEHKKKKVEKLKLILFCDVSKSMELYSKFLIQFMYGLNRASTKIETFVFSTKLARITKNLRFQDFGIVLEKLRQSFDQWSGGTKIGGSLLEFKNAYGDQLLDQKTKVIILSDGWDTDDPEKVEEALSFMKRRCSSIIWLNPLAGNPNFKPETACLIAAMPYIDIFQAANTIESLESLIHKLN